MLKLRLTSRSLLIASAVSFVWLALVITAPYLVPPGTLRDLSGRVGTMENTAAFSELGPLPRAVYTIGDIECHQLAARSYFLNGNQMPFCARDLGLFVGLTAGFVLASIFRFRGNPVLLLLGLVPLAVDGGAQLVTSYESTNPLRLATGIIAGAALALLIAVYVYAFEALSAAPAGTARPPDGQ